MRQDFIKFWNWFEVHEAGLRDDAPSENLVRDLGTKLAEFGFFDWEMGPSDRSSDAHYLTIKLSDFDDDGVKFRNQFLAAAPNFTHWEFLTSRPPKNWSRNLIWGRNRVPVSAGDFRFSLYKYNDGKFDIILNTNLPRGIEPHEKRGLAICILASELGEPVLYEKVNAIDVEEKSEAEISYGLKLSEIASVLADERREGSEPRR